MYSSEGTGGMKPTEAVKVVHMEAMIELSWLDHDLRVAQERHDLLSKTLTHLEWFLVPAEEGRCQT